MSCGCNSQRGGTCKQCKSAKRGGGGLFDFFAPKPISNSTSNLTSNPMVPPQQPSSGSKISLEGIKLEIDAINERFQQIKDNIKEIEKNIFDTNTKFQTLTPNTSQPQMGGKIKTRHITRSSKHKKSRRK